MSLTQEDTGVRDQDPVVNQIVTTIADRLDTDVFELPPLEHTVDTEALASILQSGTVSTVSLSYHGHDIVLSYDDGDVSATVHGN